MYKRKTIDTYQLHVDYGQGWEHEVTEFTRKELKARIAEYKANCSYPLMGKKVREKINT